MIIDDMTIITNDSPINNGWEFGLGPNKWNEEEIFCPPGLAKKFETNELITEVGPTPPYFYGKIPDWICKEVGPTPPYYGGGNNTSVDDSGATLALLGLSLMAVALVRRFK